MKNSILLIDDEAEIRRLTARLLTPHGYTIAEAENGAEGLKKLSEENFSLLILDQNMPVMDGLTFLDALRHEVNSDVPVLMMSGNADAELRKKCYALGVFDFIKKPESSDILLARVQNGLKVAELLEFHREIKTELRVSAAIMKKLAIPAEIRGDKFFLQTFSKSFTEVGGDIALAFGTETDKPVFIIGDITGHGVSAALFAIFVSVATRRAYRESLLPHKILTRLNRELAEYLPASYFVTMFCCCLDIKAGSLSYANAGHPAPFICTRGKARQLENSQAPVLGINAHQEYAAEIVEFDPGDWLCMYTDGVFDLFEGEKYVTDKTIHDIVYQNLPGDVFYDKVVSRLNDQLNYFDDRTLMALNRI